jgi:hypothetical protein
MAKTRHRTFEIFEFLQEASDSLASKAARINAYGSNPESWEFECISVVARPSGVIQVGFKNRSQDEEISSDAFGEDLKKLAEMLGNGSRVLLDFEGVSEFGAAAIGKLVDFHHKLQSKGSRVVLCNLESGVRDSFYP